MKTDEPDWEQVQEQALWHVLRRYPQAEAEDLSQVFALGAFNFWKRHTGTAKFTKTAMLNRGKYDVIDHLRRERGRTGTAAEAALARRQAVLMPCSLDAARAGTEQDDISLADILEDKKAVPPPASAAVSDWLRELLIRLPLRNRWLLYQRGVLRNTLKQVGKAAGRTDCWAHLEQADALNRVEQLERLMGADELGNVVSVESQIADLLLKLPIERQYTVLSKLGRRLVNAAYVPGVPTSAITNLNEMLAQAQAQELMNLGVAGIARAASFGVSMNNDRIPTPPKALPTAELESHMLPAGTRRADPWKRKARVPISAPHIAPWQFVDDWPRQFMHTPLIRLKAKIWFIVKFGGSLTIAEIARELSRYGVDVSSTALPQLLGALRKQQFVESTYQGGLAVYTGTEHAMLPRPGEILAMHIGDSDTVNALSLKQYLAESAPGTSQNVAYVALRRLGFTQSAGPIWERTTIPLPDESD